MRSIKSCKARIETRTSCAQTVGRGRCSGPPGTDGRYLVSVVPQPIREYRALDVAAQRVKWVPERWIDTFTGYEAIREELVANSEMASGIPRQFIHDRSAGDPVELFLMAMAWGYSPKDYGPARTRAVLNQDGAADKIGAIVAATRSGGAAAGWHALLNTDKINGLNMSFGTKLLYFAGYTTGHRPRPLVLDERVRAALNRPDIAPGTVPPTGLVRQADYVRYLELAEEWAADPTWRQEPDVVEYGLFSF